MVTKLSKSGAMVAAGIFADMTVDGPDIGTLVVIVDRAKNLPNRKTMGKQDPYCACRLGKEAKKTETDKRGGQVPKWDQELRFTVHDSADYYNLKVSVFNDDKKTELIGETFIDLVDVVKPGGGQSDTWHNLNCKGKYAGEIRLEMTYYDSRPKPEKPEEPVYDVAGSLNGSTRNTPVRRRPLPNDPTSIGGSPADQGRPLPPAGGPREFGTPSRPLPQAHAPSAGHTSGSQRRTVHNNGLPQPVEHRPASSQRYYPETPDDPFIQEQHYAPSQAPSQAPYATSQAPSYAPSQAPSQAPSYAHSHAPSNQDNYSSYGGYEPNPPAPSQHDEYQYQDNPSTGLPELPPMRNHRRQNSHRPSQEPLRTDYSYAPPKPQPLPQPELHHSYSAPSVPVQPPYPEDMMHPRDIMHHTQSDGFMNHGQPARLPARQDYHEPYQQPQDPYPQQSQELYPQKPQEPYHQQPQEPYSQQLQELYSQQPPKPQELYSHQAHEMDANPSYHNLPQPVQPAQPAPMHDTYKQAPEPSNYRPPSQQYQHSPPNQYQLEAPPPPPVHRDSAPSSARRQSYSSFVPAPLNVTPSRRSPSPYVYQEPEQFAQSPQPYPQPSEYSSSRRNTEPVHSSPVESQVYRPRALSGEAMRNMQRPQSRDDQYALPPSHPDYYSPITGTPPEWPDNRITPSRQPASYQSTPVSPLAVESPHSLRGGDIASLPSQQNTPSRASRYHQQPSPTKMQAPIPPRTYGNHHHTASEPYIPPTNYQTPPRPHPLAQQVPAMGSSPTYLNNRQSPPQERSVIRPIAISAHNTPASEPRNSRPATRSTPTTRKSVSPRPPASETNSEQRRPTSTHFGPDSFDQYNPAAAASSSSLINHPATSGPGTPAESASGNPSPYTKDGKIVDWHGNHIDPSDRLPETSWAPEPEPKGPLKDRPWRERERIGGARDLNVTMSLPKSSPRASTGGNSPADSPTTNTGVIRARLKKKERPASAIVMSNSSVERPFRDIPNPVGPVQRSPGAYDYSPVKSSPGFYGSVGASPAAGNRASVGYGAPPPPIPAKVPLIESYPREDLQALTEEMSRIDIGAGSNTGSAPRGRVGRGRLLGFRS